MRDRGSVSPLGPQRARCPSAWRNSLFAFFLWDGMPLGFFLPQPALELCGDSEGWQLRRCDRSSQGVVELTGKGAARASGSMGRGAHGRSPRDGAAAAGRLLPVVGFLLLCVLLQRTFFPRKQEFSPVPLAELQVLLKSHNRNGLLSAR